MSTKKIGLYISGKNTPKEGLNGLDISSLDTIPDRSLRELDISDTLEFVSRAERGTFLRRVSRKLVKDGIIYMTGLDIKRLSLAVFHGSISNEEAEKVVLDRSSFIDVDDLKNYAEVVIYWTEGLKFHAEIKVYG